MYALGTLKVQKFDVPGPFNTCTVVEFCSWKTHDPGRNARSLHSLKQTVRFASVRKQHFRAQEKSNFQSFFDHVFTNFIPNT